jgi:hypothetical protein
MHLFAPATYRPVMLSRTRFAELSARLATDENRTLAAAAKRAPMDLAALLEVNRRATVGVVDFTDVVLLLPGPYGACARRSLPPVVPGG